MLLPSVLMAQEKENAFDVYQKYVSDCNQLVLDTIIESGTIHMEYKPFKMDGNECLMLVPIDTVWNEMICKEYKYYETSLYLSNGFSIGNTYTLMNTSSNFSYGTKQISQMSENITREKICKIKRRRPSFSDFWDRWCVENGYIKN